ncbi:MAG: peptidase and DD-carboxypeptidase VanY/endolysin [Parcubacteria group bacterium]|nr:peptidase and DD-carboxypeptidase VanY/endolysin [Parcubacteria group bacterium]
MIRGDSRALLFALGILLVIGGGAGYGAYTLGTRLGETRSELASTTAAKTSVATELARTRADNEQLSAQLAEQVQKNLTLGTQVDQIASTVTTLTKLSQTDKELLQKYSRVYFLNENYIPSSLSEIDPLYQLDPSRHLQIHSKVKPFLENMLTDASDAGVPIVALSGYRSFAEQKTLKSSYTVTYGSGSNRFSADQGYSEHQLGTAVDLTTKSIAGTSLAFATSPAGIWLDANAYKYGFILSYPKGNTYYQYEPWHWRFIGVALATKLHDTAQHFYDLPQRDMDTYLVSIFD